MQTERAEALAPPVGFRKAIPTTVKLDAVIRQDGRCKSCGERLGKLTETQFDHTPAIQLRGWDPSLEDTIPASNDPEHIIARHKDCHAAKTSGRKGESKLNAVHGDTAEIAKLRRVTASEIAFRRRLLGKDQPVDAESPAGLAKPRSRWPKRPFNRGRKRGSSAETAEEHDALAR